MPVPDYQTLMRPVLGLVLERERSVKEVVAAIADLYDLSEEERAELIPSGTATVLTNRVNWAITYMAQAKLVERPRRAVIVATQRGREVYRQHPDRIDNKVLSHFDDFQAFQSRSRKHDEPQAGPHSTAADNDESDFGRETPDERIDIAEKELSLALRAELLARITKADPAFFEHLIIDLMLAMGYGGSGEGKHLGKTADGGVDGVINEDPLGLDVVFLQAKRYAADNVIAVSQIREFAGTLDERGAVKGVFVTTSSFAAPARTYAERSPKRLVLIDGDELTRLLVRYGVGVRSLRIVELKRLDEDYFTKTLS